MSNAMRLVVSAGLQLGRDGKTPNKQEKPNLLVLQFALSYCVILTPSLKVSIL